MLRIVLASSLMGKTYTNTTYSNVYDFDQHTLSYKYNREDCPHLTDEQFKGLPGRRINHNWFPTYMNDFCRLIDTTSHDVVLGWLQHHVVDELIVRGYRPELVLSTLLLILVSCLSGRAGVGTTILVKHRYPTFSINSTPNSTPHIIERTVTCGWHTNRSTSTNT